MEFVMSRLFVFATTALLSVAAQTALSQEIHESPEAEQGKSNPVRVEAEVGRLYSPYDLASSGLAADDIIWVSSFASSKVADGSSRNDY